MEPLIKITNVPIAFEMKVNNAHLEYKNGTADLEIKKERRQDGNFQQPDKAEHRYFPGKGFNFPGVSFQQYSKVCPSRKNSGIRSYRIHGAKRASYA